ncbi:transcriptional regulator [Sphingomonas panacis]|uniref:Transcriptional regulator n=1 Tax=Sphingomonas panacis TaxID=1560345 RepID=A0A1B3ZCZ8_9SPHN|nr:MucR family transcriptional regulator [Sphingomonas panacis]AOH85299.1 transcriptional regulator [Sphingomonas panacis]
MAEETLNSIELATELTIAWLGNQNNRVSAEDVPAFLRTMHGTLLELESGSSASDAAGEETATADAFPPAVSVRKSLASKDHIISMIDGKPYKTLRRHLSTHGLTDVQYRERYNLRPDYPMVSENYSLARRAMAQRIGLGRKGRGAAPAPDEAPAANEPSPAPTPAKRTRRKADEAA